MHSSKLGKLNYQRVIDIDEYNDTYLGLKLKYAKTLVENWTECTDPLKYVHEDLGIASYLILLWGEKKPCNFVDLGCGNGLLVYILTEEGHAGYGVDVRSRNIWNSYPKTTVLKEETVIPSSNSIYPDADWLIGNHSDELTIWLPIMAARSNNRCNFFTIPCCPYNLNGKKYQRKNAKLSVYQDFLEYVQDAGELCGFSVTADKMKIPSTKRICLIGQRNNADPYQTDENIEKFINGESLGFSKSNDTEWIEGYTPRAAVEPVRNCTRIPKEKQMEIIDSVAKRLLEDTQNITLEDGRMWNQGGTLNIAAAASILPPELLQALRLECKGLQTLLKNHHQVFFVKSGFVSLRSPSSLKTVSDTAKSRNDYKWKMKTCWFHSCHPDGCPISDANCSYKHGDFLSNKGAQ